MLVVARFTVDPAAAATFTEQVSAAVAAMNSRPGHLGSRLARAIDDVTTWTLVSEWRSVGDYRRAIGNAEVRMASAVLMGSVRDEPTSYEVLWDSETGAQPSDHS